MANAISVPARYSGSKYVTSLAKRQASTAKRARSLQERLKSPFRAAWEGGFTLLGASGAAVIDTYAPKIPLGKQAILPSIGAGFGAIGLGFALGSPITVSAGFGALAPHQYDWTMAMLAKTGKK